MPGNSALVADWANAPPATASSTLINSRFAQAIGMHLLTAAQLLLSLGDQVARAVATEVAFETRDRRTMTDADTASCCEFWKPFLMPKDERAGSSCTACKRCSVLCGKKSAASKQGQWPKDSGCALNYGKNCQVVHEQR